MNTLTPAQQLSLMIAIASQGHVNQFDKGGQPYILHPLRVMFGLNTDDLELMCIAIGHDYIEDCQDTLENLKSKGFSQRVLNAWAILTHDKNVPYNEYIENICTNYDCILTKISDITDNTKLTRLKGYTKKDMERVEKYIFAHKKLMEAKKAYEMCIRA